MATSISNVPIKIPTNASATIMIPDGAFGDACWSADASKRLTAAKMELFTKAWSNFALAIGATPVAREEIVFVAQSAGSINRFAALLNDTGTATDCDFVLKKNGTTIMSSDLTITHATSDKVVVEGSLTSTTFVAGDVFSIQLVVNSSTGAQGPYAWAEFVETLS
jgi:predicted RNA-binding protein